MKKRRSFYTLSLLVILLGSLTFIGTLEVQSRNIRVANFSFWQEEIQQKIISLPNFFRFNSVLTEGGVALLTNTERLNNNYIPLENSEKLNQIAQRRLRDMIQKQYFAHYSPDGRGVQDEAYDVDFKFLSIGENIALGDFRDDKDLVKAWMNSADHRKNILSNKYTQIGIAVEKNMFEGENTWLAVQVFGRPQSDCMLPDQNQRNYIESQKVALEKMAERAKSIYSDMNYVKNSGNIQAFNQKVPVYNALVNDINYKSENLKNTINSYNGTVNNFNFCLNN